MKMKNHTISEMTLAEYLFVFSDDRTVLSDTYVRQASEYGRLFCAKDNDTYLGYICMSMDGGIEQILYAYTKLEFRRRGGFTSLAEHIIRTADHGVGVAIHEHNPHFDEVVNVCRRLGFEETECVHVFSLDRGSKEAWERFKERQHYDQCRAFLERFGYETVSFEKADDELVRQIENSHETSFGNPFHAVDFFRYPSRNLSREFSYATVRNGELAAFVLVSQPSSDALLVEQMVTSVNTRDSGVLLLPLVSVADSFHESGMQRLSFAIYPHNKESNRVRETIGKEVKFTDTVTHNYYFRKQMEEQE